MCIARRFERYVCLDLDSESSTLSRFERRAPTSFHRYIASTECKYVQLPVLDFRPHERPLKEMIQLRHSRQHLELKYVQEFPYVIGIL